MSDLISRSALLLKLREEVPDKWDADINYFICNAPAVEAKPVVHGEWMEAIGENYWFDYTCSICGELEEFDYNFCPNCGADMRKKV